MGIVNPKIANALPLRTLSKRPQTTYRQRKANRLQGETRRLRVDTTCFWFATIWFCFKSFSKTAELTSAIEITDPTVRLFNVWTGARNFVNGLEARQGFIIDWANRRILFHAPPREVERISSGPQNVGDSLDYAQAQNTARAIRDAYDGLPIGVEIVGRIGDDATVLRAGHAFEKL
jgi:hypothetical protein